ncbi:acetyl-CoA synthetase-like protein [Westerdykella ornata]|uniref:Acetyl-CoA synthetase-like protein n=1 Tax=Westerdykella ornata TaxID=318751 RepID=A0A6A6JJK0_WESOR|nr:acetyl-CoA synthetase-like protein [Westerdykella ornata]KAF2276642.1 acetyl-CoA synthetase-like protein [Westerdykella ornata]
MSSRTMTPGEAWITRLCSSLHICVVQEVALALNIPMLKIDFNSSFIENGGDSLSSLNLQSSLRNLGIYVTFETILTAKSILELVHSVTSSRRHVPIDGGPWEYPNRTGNKRRPSVSSTCIDVRHRKRIRRASSSASTGGQQYPMTELQLAFIHSRISYPERNVILYQEVHKTGNIPALREAWKKVLKSEPIFRMRFEINESGGFMIQEENAKFDWEEIIVDSTEMLEQQTAGNADDLDEQDGLLLNRFKVVTFRERSYVIWRVHHALIDGHSQALLQEKLQKALTGQKIVSGPSFGEFALQLRALQERCKDIGKSYWSKQHQEHPAATSELLLPAPTPSSIDRSKHVQEFVRFNIDLPELSLFCKHIGITLSSVYSAAWALTISQFMDSDDVSFGSALCGRTLPIPGAESIVGPTINTLPVFIRIDRTVSVMDWLRYVLEQLAQLTSFQWTTSEHGVSRKFSTALNVQLAHPELCRTQYDPIEHPLGIVLSDVPLHVDIASNGSIQIGYHTTSYSSAQVEIIAETFRNALQVLQRPSVSMSECLGRVLPRTQATMLSRFGNWEAATTREDFYNEDLVSLFTKAVAACPEEIAVSRGSRQLTYQELDRKSSIVSERLRQYVHEGDVVCVHADRSLEWIIAIYGILKAEAVYCPFAEDMPSAVRDMNFQTAKARVFLTPTENTKQAKPESCEVCLSVEEIFSVGGPSAEAESRLTTSRRRPNSPAYLCFTSGSTGKPKGVLCRHRGLVAFQSDPEVRLFSRPKRKIAQVMSPNFDGSIHEIFSALSYGAELVLKDAFDPFGHIRSADSVILTPSVAKAMNPDDYPRLETVYLVGEAVPQKVCDDWASKKILYNMYGPTEATCGATIKRLYKGQPVTLGVPNVSTRIYILNKEKRLVPPGTIGEIYLAGVQVALGYVGRPAETKARFLTDTILPATCEYMYRTGDRGFWSESGQLIFLGRSDRQIKLRGFRVDLDDLEIRMLEAGCQVKAVAVAAQDDHLIAQVQPADIDLVAFKEALRKHIPPYAMPRHISAVDAFPLTAVGKLDYKKVISQASSPEESNSEERPLDHTERIIVMAVRDILGFPTEADVNLDASFADLGGHSIFYLQLSHRLAKILKRPVPLQLLLETPSLRALSTALRCSDANDDFHYRVPSHPLGEHGVSPIEKDWCEKHRVGSSSSFNVTFASRLDESVKIGRLKTSWDHVLRRHRILSSTYDLTTSTKALIFTGLRREYFPTPPTAEIVPTIDIDREINIAFDLHRDYLIKVLISPKCMLVVISHILCDYTTLKLLLHEVAETYEDRPLPVVRKEYSQVQVPIRPSPGKLAFWANYLSGAEQSLDLGFCSKPRATWAGTSRFGKIPMNTHRLLRTFATRHQVTMHQVALGAVAMAFTHHAKICDITLGAPYLNRHSEEEQNVVGLFLEPLPVRIYHDPTGSGTFIQSVKTASRAALSNAVPWHHLLSHLGINPAFPNHPIFEVMVTFHDVHDSVEFTLPGSKPIETWAQGAKFKLMAEFTARSDGALSLRLEYSTECFNEDEIRKVERLIRLALTGLAANEGFDDVRMRLRNAA